MSRRPDDSRLLDWLLDHPHARVVIQRPIGAMVVDFADGMETVGIGVDARAALAQAVELTRVRAAEAQRPGSATSTAGAVQIGASGSKGPCTPNAHTWSVDDRRRLWAEAQERSRTRHHHVGSDPREAGADSTKATLNDALAKCKPGASPVATSDEPGPPVRGAGGAPIGWTCSPTRPSEEVDAPMPNAPAGSAAASDDATAGEFLRELASLEGDPTRESLAWAAGEVVAALDGFESEALEGLRDWAGGYSDAGTVIRRAAQDGIRSAVKLATSKEVLLVLAALAELQRELPGGESTDGPTGVGEGGGATNRCRDAAKNRAE